MPIDQTSILFETPADWAKWLAKHHVTSSGLWLRLAKKGATVKSLSYVEALDVALCHGWIDAQKKGESDEIWLQRFTPRTKKSIWSKINREKVAALVAGGRMLPAGIAEVERAKKDGRWDAAYDGARTITVPEDFQEALEENPKAKAFFAKLDSANRYALLFRIHTAKKAETRAKKILQFVQMLADHKKFHET